MNEVVTILYEASAFAEVKRLFYDRIASGAGLTIEWVQDEANENLMALNVPAADAVLLSGRESFDTVYTNGMSVLVSENGEKRLVALFAPEALAADRLNARELKLAADFGWQADMIATFLAKALPGGNPARISGAVYDESSDTRLERLGRGEIDIAIVPLTHLNATGQKYRAFPFMVLPLVECTPAIYQGTTSIVFRDAGHPVVKAIAAVVDPATTKRAAAEHDLSFSKKNFNQGIFSMILENIEFSYLAAQSGQTVKSKWFHQAGALMPKSSTLFSTTDYMKDFFHYEDSAESKVPAAANYFVATHKAVEPSYVSEALKGKMIWAAGTRTWFELAKKGYWVNGSADGLGMETLASSWQGGFLDFGKADLCIITNAQSARHWQQDGYAAIGTYELIPSLTTEIIGAIQKADVVFWTSFQQYQACRQYLKAGVRHAAPAGKTASLLKAAGLSDLVIFPSIKAFIDYREKALVPERNSNHQV